MACSKTRYRDRIAALNAVAKFQRLDAADRAKIPQRACRCPHCRGWHLTSQHRRPRSS